VINTLIDARTLFATTNPTTTLHHHHYSIKSHAHECPAIHQRPPTLSLSAKTSYLMPDAGPNDVIVVYAPSKFFSFFLSCFYEIPN
jgi:hypothetical protein